ncbi:MAG: hypothetical protein A2157_16535 [Deltaproteobacteria bacterium RBG_16_47_11]|nr:MAG: hypothetical protein A2157_16535 [Deltaproteobacteria bacterium RBG_16_47_11]
MEKTKIGSMVGLMIGLTTLMTSPAFARSITFKRHGTVLWIFRFIGTITAIVFKKESKVEEEVVLLDTEAVEVRRQRNIMRGDI